MPGPQLAAGRRERLEAVEQRIHQRAAAARVLILPRPGVNHHPGRLVHHRQVGVLVNHVQRNVFRRGLERRGMRLAGNGDALAAAQLERSLLALAIDQHIALVHEQLHARAAHALQLRGEELVEPLPGCLRGHFDGAQFSHFPASAMAPRAPFLPLLSGSNLRPQRALCAPAAPALRPAPAAIAAACGPSSAPPSSAPRPSGSRQNSVMKTPRQPHQPSPATSPCCRSRRQPTSRKSRA
jgi:hypothetical protein